MPAVRVRVPATSANLGPGFDALGLALGLHDEVRVEVAPDGLVVEVTGEGAEQVARDESHLVVRAVRAAFDAAGARQPGLRLTCTNRIPHGRGLGSSAAAAVAGVVAGSALLERGLDADRQLVVAAALEGHADNAAPCLLGGLTVAWSADGGRASATRLPVDPSVRPVALVPAATQATEAARALLPPTVPHADAAFTAGRAALLVAALTGRPDLLGAATQDRLHQPYRLAAQPAGRALLASLRDAGVPAVLSGSGPTVLALARSDDEVATTLRLAGPGVTALSLPVDLEGARVVPA